jgi:hypothetical protein
VDVFAVGFGERALALESPPAVPAFDQALIGLPSEAPLDTRRGFGVSILQDVLDALIDLCWARGDEVAVVLELGDGSVIEVFERAALFGDLKRGRTFGEEVVDHLSRDFGVEAFEFGRLDVATAPLDLLAGMLVEHDVIPHEDRVDPPAWARTTKLEQAANSVFCLWCVWDLAINHELVDVAGHLARLRPEHETQLRIHGVSPG